VEDEPHDDRDVYVPTTSIGRLTAATNPGSSAPRFSASRRRLRPPDAWTTNVTVPFF